MIEAFADPYVPNDKNHSQLTGPIAEELFQRQESGKACIFPGPMWYPLRLLSVGVPPPLRRLEVKIPPYHRDIDLRNYHTIFQETAQTIRKARETLETLVLYFGNEPGHYNTEPDASGCGHSNSIFRSRTRPSSTEFAARFLKRVLEVFHTDEFPLLRVVDVRGFNILEKGGGFMGSNEVETALSLARSCSRVDIAWTEKSCVDHHWVWCGFLYDVTAEGVEKYAEILQNS